MSSVDSFREVNELVVILSRFKSDLLIQLVPGSNGAIDLSLCLFSLRLEPSASEDWEDHSQRANAVPLLLLDRRAIEAPLTSRPKPPDLINPLSPTAAQVLSS